MLTPSSLPQLAEEVNRFLDIVRRKIEPYEPQIRAFFELSEADQIRLMATGFIQAQEREKLEVEADRESDRRAMYKAWNRLNN